jgi:hypothetical protein
MKRLWTVVLAKLAYDQQKSITELERLINLNDNTDELSELIDSELARLAINELKIRKWHELNPNKQTAQPDADINN